MKYRAAYVEDGHLCHRFFDSMEQVMEFYNCRPGVTIKKYNARTND